MRKQIGVFVAWPYANGELHLGHIAGAYLPADIFARYHRLRGNEVIMVSGSDTHGTPITLKAREENTDPWSVVNRFHGSFLRSFQGLGISFNLFTHTHTKNHIEISQQFFLKLLENGDLLTRSELQLFDESAQVFLPDRYVSGTCPKCGNTRARGDQCEACGSTYAATELLNPISKISNTAPIVRDTQHYFFDIARYKQKLKDFLDARDHMRLAVKNFSLAMVEDGLEPRPITRDIDWGVPVPVAGWEHKVLYVWFDAVIGYYSGSVEFSARSGDSRAWEKWWLNPEAKGYYFIGKDNVPFHTVIWPAELMAFNPNLNLPYDVPANHFLNFDGEKFSTSRGLGVWLNNMLVHFNPDAIRYYLVSIFPETKDSNFSWDEFAAKSNGELMAAWGNLVNRVLGFLYSKFNARVPEPLPYDERDEQLLRQVEATVSKVSKLLDEVNLRDGLREAMSLVRDVNKYLDDKAPWTEFKKDTAKAGSTLFVALRAIDTLKVILAPYLPFSCEVIHRALGYRDALFGSIEIEHDSSEDYDYLAYKENEIEKQRLDQWQLSALKPGTEIEKIGPLFPIVDLEKVTS